MEIEYRRGDIFLAPERALGHGCNARGEMGPILAKQVKERYPGAYDAYRAMFESKGLKLGQIVPWISPDRVILNMITQDGYGPRGRRYVDYDAVRRAFAMVETGAARHIALRKGFFFDQPRLAIPRIGVGNGGGDWKIISAVIEAEVRSVQVVVYSR